MLKINQRFFKEIMKELIFRTSGLQVCRLEDSHVTESRQREREREMETIKRIREFISELPWIRIAHKNPLHALKVLFTEK